MSGMEPERLPDLSPEQSALLARRRRGRNYAMLAALIGVAVLFFAMALVRLHTPDLVR